MLYLVMYTLKCGQETKKFNEYWRLFTKPTASLVQSHWTYVCNIKPEVIDFAVMPAVENINCRTIVEV